MRWLHEREVLIISRVPFISDARAYDIHIDIHFKTIISIFISYKIWIYFYPHLNLFTSRLKFEFFHSLILSSENEGPTKSIYWAPPIPIHTLPPSRVILKLDWIYTTYLDPIAWNVFSAFHAMGQQRATQPTLSLTI